MTIQTPREAAEALLKSAYDVPHEVDNRPWLDKVEAAFAARDRALLMARQTPREIMELQRQAQESEIKVDHKETDYRLRLSAESTRDLISMATFCIQELPPQDRRHKLGEKLIRQIRLTQ